MGLLPGGDEMIVILLIVLLLFGAASIPKLARSLGRAKGEFNKARREFDSEAAKGEAELSSTPSPASDDQVRRTARELGIDPAGKSVPELKQLIQRRLA